MAIEDVFSISGRGTVVTGKIETDIKVGDEVEIVGIRRLKSTYEFVEFARCEAGDNAGVGRGLKREDVERGQVLAKCHTYEV